MHEGQRERERERDDSLFEERSSAYRTGSSNISNYRRSVDLHARRERIRKFASRGEVKHGQSPRDPKRERERGGAETPPRGRVFAAAYSDIVGREDSANRIPVSFTGENEQRATREVGERA